MKNKVKNVSIEDKSIYKIHNSNDKEIVVRGFKNVINRVGTWHKVEKVLDTKDITDVITLTTDPIDEELLIGENIIKVVPFGVGVEIFASRVDKTVFNIFGLVSDKDSFIIYSIMDIKEILEKLLDNKTIERIILKVKEL